MCFIEWCNESQGFLSFTLSLISIAIAICIPVYLARNQKKVDLFQIKFDFYLKVKSEFNQELETISEIADWYGNQKLWKAKIDPIISEAYMLFGRKVGNKVKDFFDKYGEARTAKTQIEGPIPGNINIQKNKATLEEYQALCQALQETLEKNIRIKR